MTKLTNLPDNDEETEELDYNEPVAMFVYGTLKNSVNKNSKFQRSNRFFHYLEDYAATARPAYLQEEAYFFELISENGISLFPAVSFKKTDKMKKMEPRMIKGEVYTIPTFMLTLLDNIEGVYFNYETRWAYVGSYEDDAVYQMPVGVYIANLESLLPGVTEDEIKEIKDGVY